jgi:amphi-Trp domain-containing protein
VAEFSWTTVATRADAAALLRRLADALDAGPDVSLEQDGVRLALEVPDQVTCQLEAEIDPGSGESELEIELRWSRASAAGAQRAKQAKNAA